MGSNLGALAAIIDHHASEQEGQRPQDWYEGRNGKVLVLTLLANCEDAMLQVWENARACNLSIQLMAVYSNGMWNVHVTPD